MVRKSMGKTKIILGRNYDDDVEKIPLENCVNVDNNNKKHYFQSN